MTGGGGFGGSDQQNVSHMEPDGEAPSTDQPPEGQPEEEKPPKPDPEEQLPEEGEDASDLEPIDPDDSEFMSPEEADADPTVDNRERPDGPEEVS